jgi:hypothetical protein
MIIIYPPGFPCRIVRPELAFYGFPRTLGTLQGVFPEFDVDSLECYLQNSAEMALSQTQVYPKTVFLVY